MAKRKIFHRQGYSYLRGGAVITLLTLVGGVAGILLEYDLLPKGLTPEEFGHEAAPVTLVGAALGFASAVLVEYPRWHYSRR